MRKNLQIGIIIQARISSARLPGKVMLKLANKEVLWHVVKRCQKSRLTDTVIVATSVNTSDDKIEKFCEKYGFSVYRGSLNNVLERYYFCAKKYNLKTIIRITSDCPLIDPAIIDMAIKKFERGRYDYLSNIIKANQTNFPIGLSVEVFSFLALEKNYKEAKTEYKKEHVTPHFYENMDKFKVAPIIKPLPGYNKSYRITIDYPEDFKLMQAVYKNLYLENDIIDTRKALAFLAKNPYIAKINSNVAQKSYK